MEDILNEIKEISQDLMNQDLETLPATELSRLMTRLAILNANLGELKTKAQIRLNNYTFERKRIYSEAEQEARKEHGITAARSIADAKTIEIKEKEIKAENTYILIRDRHEDVNKLISTIQSRLKTLANERMFSQDNIEPEAIDERNMQKVSTGWPPRSTPRLQSDK